MLVLMLIALGLGAFTMVYLWVVSARLDRIQERQKRIDADLKKRRLTYKKAKENVLKQIQAEKKAKAKPLSKVAQEEFNLFKELIINSGSVEINGTMYLLMADGKRFMHGNTLKVYPLNEQGWREMLDDYERKIGRVD